MAENVSCLRCRKLKIKCSKGFPACARCTRLQSSCVYPAPPDRKLIARTRKPGRRRRDLSDAPAVTQYSQKRSPPSPTHGAALSQGFGGVEYERTRQLPSLDGGLASQATALALFNIYFDSVLNSHLLFRKEVLVQRYLTDSVPTYVLQSIFASSLLFFGHDEPSGNQSSVIKSNHRLQSEYLARKASAEIYAHIDCPSTDIFATCFNLLIYWFRVGKGNQLAVHSALIHQLDHVLRINGSSKAPEDTIKKHRLWAWWQYQLLIDCSASSKIDLSLAETNPLEDRLQLQTPSSEVLWLQVIIAVKLWSDSRNFIYTSQLAANFELVRSRLGRLDARLDMLSRHSPCITSGYYRTLNELQCGVLIWSVYHLCKVILYTYTYLALQVRSACAGEESWLTYQDVCLQTISHHTTAFSCTLSKNVLGRISIASIPPFIGYCSFVVASVSLRCLRNYELQKNESTPYIYDIAIPPLVLLRDLGCYWHSIKEMWDRIQSFLPNSCLTRLYQYDSADLPRRDILSSPSLPCQDSIIIHDLALVIGEVDISDPVYLRTPHFDQ